jgi:hypothetical protein
MSKANTQKKSKQLGMPYGTACNRLRKSIMFDFMRRLGLDKCFRCGHAIVSTNDMSIEHKESWLDVSVDLFWDLDNIAFSHLSCNSSNRERIVNRYGEKKIGIPGMAWCVGCQDFLPIMKFNKNSDRWDNTQDYCRKCQKAMRK